MSSPVFLYTSAGAKVFFLCIFKTIDRSISKSVWKSVWAALYLKCHFSQKAHFAMYPLWITEKPHSHNQSHQFVARLFGSARGTHSCTLMDSSWAGRKSNSSGMLKYKLHSTAHKSSKNLARERESERGVNIGNNKPPQFQFVHLCTVISLMHHTNKHRYETAHCLHSHSHTHTPGPSSHMYIQK